MRDFLICLLLSISIASTSKAQSVKLISLNALEERFKQGRDTTYVLNCWATWCAPCIKEMPYFDALQQKYAAEPLKVIFLSLDFKSQAPNVQALLNKKNFKSEVYLIDKKSEQEFIEQVSKNWEGAIPATLFVNKNKDLRKFYQQEFDFQELERTYQSIK